MKPVSRALLLLIGPHPVEALHEEVPYLRSVHHAHDEGRIQMEARIRLKPYGIKRYDGYLLHSRLFKRPPYESHIISRPAAASGLAHYNCGTVKVIFA